MANRPYVFFELTNSICSTCHVKVEAKIVLQDGSVYMLKRCPEHGPERVLVSTDEAYYRQQRNFLKPGQVPLKFHTRTEHGCPYDCGLCPDHEQHSCLTLVEVTDRCNLTCPVCYADSSPERLTHRSLEQVEFMLDRVVESEGQPDVVQISGGEPTLHPQLFDILDAARRRPIKHLMLNTNGLRIASDGEFTRRLAGYQPGFEVYLQFDSLREEPYRVLRGRNLLAEKLRALERLNALDLSTTLVVTLRKGLNDDEVGALLEFALQQPAVRGITFQPVQDAGRVEGFDPALHRLTVGEVRQRILQQSDVFLPEDVLPVPCHPDCLAMAYALKLGGEVVPLTRALGRDVLLSSAENTITYEKSDDVRRRLFEVFSTSHSPESAPVSLDQLLCCLPQVQPPAEALTYRNVFRVIVMQFLDAHSFDVRSVKRSCVHIVHPDGRIIPFDTYNLFYRDGREARLEQLRRAPSRAV
jgi:uncharacterized radical SAM superfamily Fe-S cluster-containing enzyme